MAIFIDPPRWPAHDTRWSHLISDSSLTELHEFARALGQPRRSFDLDHYDVPAAKYARAVSLGAHAVDGHELVRVLRASGLRVRSADRATEKQRRRPRFLGEQWDALGRELDAHSPAWAELGAKVLARWQEPHRRYHDPRHLEDVLLSLDQLAGLGETITPATYLAGWFHDAVYDGDPGADERASATLAVEWLTPLLPRRALIAEVHDFIAATIPAEAPTQVSPQLAQLLDADLAIFAAGEARYRTYADDVRREYSHVPEADFRNGRAHILRHYLEAPEIYRLAASRQLWEARARRNLAAELKHLTT